MCSLNPPEDRGRTGKAGSQEVSKSVSIIVCYCCKQCTHSILTTPCSHTKGAMPVRIQTSSRRQHHTSASCEPPQAPKTKETRSATSPVRSAPRTLPPAWDGWTRRGTRKDKEHRACPETDDAACFLLAAADSAVIGPPVAARAVVLTLQASR